MGRLSSVGVPGLGTWGPRIGQRRVCGDDNDGYVSNTWAREEGIKGRISTCESEGRGRNLP